MKALVTGGHGFAGKHLAHHLDACGDDVILSYRPGAQSDASELPKRAQSVALDVADAGAVTQLIAVLQPDIVYHLAALSFVPEAEKNPAQVYDVNAFSSLSILDALSHSNSEARFLLVSSAEVYGEPRPGALPISETEELRPVSVYGASKAMAEVACHRYSHKENLQVIRVRPFPHIGPGQSDRFALSSFARQVASVKLGLSGPVIKVGNLEARRDYTDVSDIVRGYREAVLNGKNGEVYNLCSNRSQPMAEYLQQLISLAGCEVEVVVDEARVREIDVSDNAGSYDRAQRHFGWKPRAEREAMLDGLLTYWLEQLA